MQGYLQPFAFSLAVLAEILKYMTPSHFPIIKGAITLHVSLTYYE